MPQFARLFSMDKNASEHLAIGINEWLDKHPGWSVDMVTSLTPQNEIPFALVIFKQGA